MRALNFVHPEHETGRSRPVSSRQRGPHPRLESVVSRHLGQDWRQPLHRPTCAAFEGVRDLLQAQETGRLVIDSGCGTGQAAGLLARRHPDAVVIAIDRSAARLARTGAAQAPVRRGRVIYARAELASFWRLARAAGWRLRAHYLLYPNPWPKPAQLRRRWHGHPAFPVLLALGGDITLRTNWPVYAREFARALRQASGKVPRLRRLTVDRPWTPFERKYAASGHALYEVTGCINGSAEAAANSQPGSGRRTSGIRPA